jgi:hypothetical protein
VLVTVQRQLASQQRRCAQSFKMATERAVGELKTQGVIEAAADPNSSVTSNDAQKKIVEESKNAGIQAFTFDPQASAQEKKAQVQAV